MEHEACLGAHQSRLRQGSSTHRPSAACQRLTTVDSLPLRRQWWFVDALAEQRAPGGCQDRAVSTAEIRDRQLQRCCDALAAVRPDAATLCSGWSAHDLALHLWSIKREPLTWAGTVLPVLAPLTRRRTELIRRRWAYEDLIAQLRSESGAIACMPLDRWEDHRHALGEYYVHTQDVARPHSVLQPTPDDELQEALWLRTRTAARILRRRLPAGLVLEHPDGRRAASGRGRPVVVVSGAPSELICWVYGRQLVAAVTVREE